jgi:hypothetical protein
MRVGGRAGFKKPTERIFLRSLDLCNELNPARRQSRIPKP